jgi:hypothetical protein
MATETHAAMEGTVVFYGVWSGTTIWKCFLWGPVPGYITKVTRGTGNGTSEVPELPSAWGYSWDTLSPGVINAER